MTPGKVTLSVVEPGARSIYVGRLKVGHAFTVWDDRDRWNGSWRAHLWCRASEVEYPGGAGVVKAFRLRDLRAELNRRLAEKGPWWS